MSNWDPYCFGASRSSPYKVLLTAAATLQVIRTKLPSAAHKIYRGYYDDIISSGSGAQDSAVAMATFVETFPTILSFHNRLAVLQNPEIERQKTGEGRVKFPLVGNGIAAGDDDEDVIKATLAQEKQRNRPKWEAERAKKGKKPKNLVASEETLAMTPEAALDTDTGPGHEMREGFPTSAMTHEFALNTNTEPGHEMSEESSSLAYSSTVTNTEADRPVVTQSPIISPALLANPSYEPFGMAEEILDTEGPAGPQSLVTLPAIPTITNTAHPEGGNNNEMGLEFPEDISDDLTWEDGLEVIDTFSWARPRSS
ncbi:hypothetical protein AA0113_g10286 [Alternaria arborescens]|uniref:Uncharacterized protein n=1 Tax=Alternaria arborescens TaxID=156630 RepID=A0A4Q4QQA6_9PLEO|nr:hypothetical protein AA0113_g10286 [Alternaria arborescens]